ncbi:MFS transporter [Microbacterium thalassium]|uniref:MFS family permease n=1 Tax=Microbacterium thalassium TaxID=362649 RepID=A0A7X0FP32_9MICO|nr:MFS transporter [Microbacterium thalassium]MBB6390517.1 MFS family permease [Microbacterium thalassium]GLK25628.1 MFS transporter [Microbacterium thalassium]
MVDTFSNEKRGSAAVLLVGVLLLVEAAGIFEHTMVLGALPFLSDHFGVDLAGISWIITIFVLVGAASAIVAGRLGDMYGRKRVLIVLLAISLVGSLVTVVFESFPALLVGRALQGTSAGIIPLLIGIARESLPKERVPMTVALLTATATITAGAGIMVAGILVDAGWWVGMFVVAAALCALCLLLAITVVPRSRSTQPGARIDWFGAILFAPAIGAMLLGLTALRGAGITSPAVWVPVGIGAVGLAVWVWWELRTTDPLVNLRLLAQPALRRVMLVIVIGGLAPLSATTILGPVLVLSPAGMPVGLGLTATTYGLISLLAAGITFALTPIAGVIAQRRGAATSMVVGLLMFVGIFVGLATPAGRQFVPFALVLIVAASVANAFVISSIYNLVVEVVPAESTSEYTGVSQVARNASIAIGTAVTATILSLSTVPETALPTESSWLWMSGYVIAVTIVALLVAISMLVGHRRRVAEAKGLLAAEPAPAAGAAGA